MVMYFKESFLNKYLSLKKDQKSSDIIVSDLVKKIMRKFTKLKSGKKPEVCVHIIRL